LREAAALKGWLMRVAANGAIDRARRPRTAPLDGTPDPADARPRADRGLERQEAQRLIDRAIAALPERQRLALSLVHFEGLTNIEAAAAMEASVEAVESLLARSRRALKEALSSRWRELLDGLDAGVDEERTWMKQHGSRSTACAAATSPECRRARWNGCWSG
jgi:RNA polymerase sigma-70 factor (ECF subfamily)